MNILDVRDGFIKFAADEEICVSSFVLIRGQNKNYVAQVIYIKDFQNERIAYAKILFLYDNGFKDYDKTTPSPEALISHFPFQKFASTIITSTPVVIGKTLKSCEDITVDFSAFDKKTIISADDREAAGIIVKNLINEFNKAGKNVIIVDSLGRLDAMKYSAGEDFKLPLNTSSLRFIFEECMNDATDESKSLIKDIFKELADYSATVPFVPFETLKNIVDDMVDNSHIFKLLVLKNKLSKFARMGYFASAKEEVERLGLILKSRSAILDISKLDSAFQNRYLNFIYETLGKIQKTQVIVELSNSITKQSLKEIYTNEHVSTLFVTHSKFKYLNDIKNVFNNHVIVPSENNNAIFKTYETFFKSMETGSYLVAGEFTNYIPLVSELFDYSTISASEAKNEIETTDRELAEKIQETLDETEESTETEAVEQNAFSAEELLESLNESDKGIEENEINENPPEVMNMFGSDDENNDSEIASENISEEADIVKSDKTKEILSEEIVDESTEETTFTSDYNTVEHPNIIINTETEYSEDDSIGEIDINAIDTESPILLAETQDAIEDACEKADAEVDLIQTKTIEEVHEQIENTEEYAPVDEVSVDIDESIDLDLESNVEEALAEENGDIIDDQELQEEIAEPEQDVIPISSENDEDYEIGEFEELETNENSESDADIIIEMDDIETDEISTELEEEIVRDVDSVYTRTKDDNLSDLDLDLIDELNSDNEVLLDDSSEGGDVLEELSSESDDVLEPPEITLQEPEEEDKQEILEKRDTSTPIVPVYDADIPPEDMVMSDPIQQGDSVIHAKYGTGVVEKMIKYGSKTLFSINFDNVGRRLLDPTLTEIKKN